MTPVRRPDSLAPGNAEAEMEGNAGDKGGELVIESCGTAASIDGADCGVAGAEEDGEGLSVTHMRWEVVATSFATVWARVE